MWHDGTVSLSGPGRRAVEGIKHDVSTSLNMTKGQLRSG
jgi:hypothetical protein